MHLQNSSDVSDHYTLKSIVLVVDLARPGQKRSKGALIVLLDLPKRRFIVGRHISFKLCTIEIEHH